MSKNLKEVLITGASLLMMASVGADLNSMGNNAHADIPGISRTLYKFDHTPGALEDQYNSNFNKRAGAFLVYPQTRHSVTKYRRGHFVTVIPNESTPGKIIRVDGRRVYSRHQVLSLMRKHSHYYYHKAKKHARKHGKKHYRRRIRRHAKRHYRK